MNLAKYNVEFAIIFLLIVIICFVWKNKTDNLQEAPNHWNDWSSDNKPITDKNRDPIIVHPDTGSLSEKELQDLIKRLQDSEKPPEGDKPNSESKPNRPTRANSFSEAKELAVAHDTPVFAVFSMQGCPACATMEQTLGSTEVTQDLSKFIYVKVDVYSDMQSAKEVGIQKVPTSIILQPNGSIAKKQVGALSVQELKSFLQ